MKNKLKVVCGGFFVLLFSVSFVFFSKNVSSKQFDETENASKNLPADNELSELTIKIASSIALSSADASFEDDQSKNNFAAMAEMRYEKLSELIESNPAEVLRVALPEDVLSKIPVEYQNYFEKREQIEGELEVIAECDDEHALKWRGSVQLLFKPQKTSARNLLNYSKR